MMLCHFKIIVKIKIIKTKMSNLRAKVDDFFNVNPTQGGDDDIDLEDADYMKKLLGNGEGAGYDLEKDTAGSRRIRGDIDMNDKDGVYEGKRVSRKDLAQNSASSGGTSEDESSYGEEGEEEMESESEIYSSEERELIRLDKGVTKLEAKEKKAKDQELKRAR
jgi:hypothetical protein